MSVIPKTSGKDYTFMAVVRRILAKAYEGESNNGAQIPLALSQEDIQTVNAAGTGVVNHFRSNASNITEFTNPLGVKFDFPVTLASDTIDSGSAQATATLTKTSDTALAVIPGLSIIVTAAGVYNFEVRLNGTSGATGGVKVQVGGTATLTSLNATAWEYNGTTLTAVTNQTSAASPLTDQAAIYTDIIIKGSFTVNAGGSFNISGAQHASNGTATTFLAGGCSMKVQRVS